MKLQDRQLGEILIGTKLGQKEVRVQILQLGRVRVRDRLQTTRRCLY